MGNKKKFRARVPLRQCTRYLKQFFVFCFLRLFCWVAFCCGFYLGSRGRHTITSRFRFLGRSRKKIFGTFLKKKKNPSLFTLFHYSLSPPLFPVSLSLYPLLSPRYFTTSSPPASLTPALLSPIFSSKQKLKNDKKKQEDAATVDALRAELQETRAQLQQANEQVKKAELERDALAKQQEELEKQQEDLEKHHQENVQLANQRLNEAQNQVVALQVGFCF